MPKPRDYNSGRVIRYYRACINDNIYIKVKSLDVTCYWSKEPIHWEDRLTGKEIKLSVGDPWGTWYECAWFKFTTDLSRVPKTAGLAVIIDIEGELLIVDNAGSPIRSLTSVGCRTPKIEYVLEKNFINSDMLELWADAGSNDLFRKQDKVAKIKRADLVMVNDKAKTLYYNNMIVENLLEILPQDSARYAQLKKAYLDSAHMVVDRGYEAFDDALKILEKQLSMKNGDYPLKISAVGHGHLDLAWLWPQREAVRKAARTLSSAVYLTKKYPGYVFGVSQPQMLQWMKTGYPKLYDEIKEAVSEGRIEPQGAMWVEADTNIPCGEALIRQIYYGQKFMKDEFDIKMNYLWLPDVFGYTAALPQILKKSGVDYFFTQKISWNSINKFPHQSFIWEGLDTSRVLSHFFPENSYNGAALPKSAQNVERNYIDKDISESALMVFGDGDGGGGPGESHIECIKRMKNLLGIPPVKFNTVADFIKEWEKDADKFSVWKGELYLEFHHGTYTTVGNSKRYNRKTEIALRDMEIKHTLAHYFGLIKYPASLTDELWKETLFYQFHDVVPGSSIKRVYDESWQGYEKMLDKMHKADLRFLNSLKSFVNINEQQTLVMNSLSWTREEYIPVGEKYIKAVVPSMGYMVVNNLQAKEISVNEMTCTDNLISNGRLSVEFDEEGSICSVTDLLFGSELIPIGQKGNDLHVYRDIGDAWDFIPSYREFEPGKPELVSKRFFMDGLSACGEFEYKYNSSYIKQKVSLQKDDLLIRFDTFVDWRDKETMLRTSFQHDICASDVVCDIQFGNVRRPLTNNTTWEMAKDEIPAHKWIDISDGETGLALITDSKYGYCAKDNRLELNLIRSAEYGGCKFMYGDTPKGEYNHDFTDQCTHTFSYALYWHKGDYKNADVIKKAYEYNIPLSIYKGTSDNNNQNSAGINEKRSFFEIDRDGVIIETVKNAYDDMGIIIRLYEYKGQRTQCRLKINFSFGDIYETDLQENVINKIKTEQLTFNPFEIRTFKITR